MVPQRASTEHEARQRYVTFLSRPLDCVTKAQWVAAPPLSGQSGTWTLSLTRQADPVRLRRTDNSAVYFRALQRFEPKLGDAGWKMHTLEYKYEVWEPKADHTTRPVIEWHFHPETGTVRGCHLHVRATDEICGVASRRLHIPSERVSFESVVRFLIEELNVKPRHSDWEDRVEEAQRAFETFRTWHGQAPPN